MKINAFKKILRIVFLCLIFNFFLTLNDTVNAKEVKFIHITDINLNTKNAYKLQETIKEINSYNDIDFVIFGGNNISRTNIDNLNTFLYLLKRVHKKAYVLLGSSDVFSTTGIDKKYYLKRVKKARFYLHPDKPNYVFKKKGYVFIAMDGTKQFFQSTNGYYNKNELIWLDKMLNKYKNKNVIIIQHFPILPAKSQWLQTVKIENYADVLKKHNNVKAIISGHYGENNETEIAGIRHIITESYSKAGAYKIIQIDSDDNFFATNLVKN